MKKQLTNAQKLTQLLQSKGYRETIIYVAPGPNAMGIDGYTVSEEDPMYHDLPGGHSRWFGYSFGQAVKSIESLSICV